MRTALFIFSILFSVNSVFAQLYVNDSYVFNKGTVIYVKDYVELNTVASNIYLRSEGQLLQGGTTVNGLNRGVGNLSVFQEGTANNFGFNYWCSPVGVGLAAAGNNPFSLNPILYRPTGLIASVQPIFTGSYNGSATDTSLAISTPWIYEYQISSAYGFGVNGWNFKGETGTISSGLGFTMKGVTGTDTTEAESDGIDNNPGNKQRYDFKGKPNDGTINIPVAPQIMGTQYPNSTLTGNPYPSAINLNLFLLENSGYSVNYTNGVVTNLSFPSPASGIINGNAYFWEHEKPATSHILVQYIGGYGFYAPNNSNAFSPGTYNNASWNTYNVDGTLNIGGVPTGTERYKRMFSPVGQGFMIEGTANGNAQMKNSYRVFQKEGVLNNSEFNKNSNAVSNVNGENWDEIPNVAGVDYTQFSKASVPQIKIYTTLDNQFTKEVTLAFNQNTTDGFDTAMDVAFNENNSQNDAYFSIVDNPNAFVINTLPFNLNKRIPFTLKAVNQAIFKVFVGNIINFSASENVYLYDGSTGIYYDIKNNYYETTLPAGIYTNRFEITFKNDEALSVSNPIKESVVVVQNNTNHILTVSNPNLIDIKSIILFDITGKLLFNKVNLGFQSSYEFSTSSFSDGVYLIKIQSADGQSIGQKIIVSSK